LRLDRSKKNPSDANGAAGVCRISPSYFGGRGVPG